MRRFIITLLRLFLQLPPNHRDGPRHPLPPRRGTLHIPSAQVVPRRLDRPLKQRHQRRLVRPHPPPLELLQHGPCLLEVGPAPDQRVDEDAGGVLVLLDSVGVHPLRRPPDEGGTSRPRRVGHEPVVQFDIPPPRGVTQALLAPLEAGAGLAEDGVEYAALLDGAGADPERDRIVVRAERSIRFRERKVRFVAETSSPLGTPPPPSSPLPSRTGR
mmetsp:Transcript_3576/g.9563  ORF Transcript_3576/g.9563 Transcript_3576/m.9563 type:complete len:215 (+) Transcript_3576:1359-2003(+)